MKLKKGMRSQAKKFQEHSFMSMFLCILFKVSSQGKPPIRRTATKLLIMEVNIRLYQEEGNKFKVEDRSYMVSKGLKPFKVVMTLM